jgi:hypothetical protein
VSLSKTDRRLLEDEEASLESLSAKNGKQEIDEGVLELYDNNRTGIDALICNIAESKPLEHFHLRF